MLLVLDDYHVIGSQPVHASVGFLLEHRPPGLHVALASRSDPPLALARLRARGQLTELRAADLRFTAGEAAGLLEQTGAGHGMPLPEPAVAALVARTEGWAAGLQLAALSLRGQDDVASFVAAFTGSHRYVLDYLAEEVLERQVLAFLLETSVLDRLSGELCDAVTGRTGSQALLEQVERAGLFLVPLDEVPGWWRYHHLFADLLRARVRHDPGALPAGRRNMIWMLFTDASNRARMVSWESAARAVLSQLRTAAGRHPDDPRFAELVAALSEASTQFREWWAEYPVRYFRPATIGIKHPRAGLIALQVYQLRLVDQPDLVMVIQVPASKTALARVTSLLAQADHG